LRQVLDCRSGSRGRSPSRSATKSRAVFFCLGFSKFWKTPIHVLLRRLRSIQNLLWLRVSMSYHRCRSHTSSCYRAIESGVLGRLAKLTSATAANLGRSMHQLYPLHAEALQRAGLNSSRLPTLRQYPCQSSGTDVAAKQQLNSIRWHVA
jgi:hypothetical protein